MRMNNLKNPLVIQGAVILLILSGAFYWFEWRPTEIKKGCYEDAIGTAKSADGSTREVYEFFYKACIQKNGL